MTTRDTLAWEVIAALRVTNVNWRGHSRDWFFNNFRIKCLKNQHGINNCDMCLVICDLKRSDYFLLDKDNKWPYLLHYMKERGLFYY